MEETRRVRFTDDYVPGPEGCPVWGIEWLWTYGVPVFIRAESEEEAWHVFNQWCDENPGEMEKLMRDAIKADDGHGEDYASWLHANADKCWKE